MQKTLLLVFIHGFKGDDQTFLTFPAHLASLLEPALPTLRVAHAVYPRFETRGDLPACVARFREWLLDRVIDLEVASGTPSPTVEPGVRVVLVGHSMGGIVAAEALLGVVWDGLETVGQGGAEDKSAGGEGKKDGLARQRGEQGKEDGEMGGPVKDSIKDSKGMIMFPYIQGVLAFDTPYFGISPGVVAHGAEGQFRQGKQWYDGAMGLFAAGGVLSGAGGNDKKGEDSKTSRSVEESSSSSTKQQTTPDTTAKDSKAGWQKWGKYAAIAAGASAVAAGGAAAYMKREQISSGVNWASSHLQFIGCLARGEELKKRVEAVAKLCDEYGVGFADIYTCLGAAADRDSAEGIAGKLSGQQRTFCNLPKSEYKRYFHKAVNDKATAETWAHMEMFELNQNPGFDEMAELARELVASWVPKDFQESSTKDASAQIAQA